MDIDPKVSAAIIAVLKQTGRTRPLGVRPLTTFANGELRTPVDADAVAYHLADLERRGYVERRANAFNPAALEWIITPAGDAL
jgi:DNA-binding HxlR family transcriptional regulator